MKRFQLATLVKWSGTLNTRKRLQKVVYLLQASGCPFEAEFTLHHYGPYSQDVASLTDKMVHAQLLIEGNVANAVGNSYSYRLSDDAQQQLERFEHVNAGNPRLRALHEYESMGRRLLMNEDLRKLELAATVAYFYQKKPSDGWGAARVAAAKFKLQNVDSKIMHDSEELAREVVNKTEA